MTTETQQFLPDFDEIPTSSYRPDQQSSGPGRLLRRVIGIREEILDWAPEERPRFTRLGAIVVNTGLVAALSLLVALSKVVSTPWWLLIPVALFWGFLILSLDGWMITSAHGVLDSAKLRALIPRLLISILIGTVIAEPLVLWFFQPAIHAEVETERRKALDEYEGMLTKCNPVSGEPVGPECRDYALNIKETPDATQQELRRMTTERDALKSKLDDLWRQWEEKEKLAREECAGKSGPQTSGRVGDGQRCQRNRAMADRFRSDNRLDQQQNTLTELDKKVAGLTTKAANATHAYGQEVAQKIAQKVKEKRDEQGMIGILDEDKGLGQLAERSPFVFAAQWLVRLLLIALDCLPVLAKLLGGTTTYDLLLARQLEIAKRLHDKHLNVREQRDSAAADIRLRFNDHDRQLKLDEIDERDRAARARIEEDQEIEIDELAARLRGRLQSDGND